MKYENILELIHSSAKKNSEATAFIFEENNFTYFDLIKFIVVAEKSIISEGIKKGDLVGVTLYQDPFNIIITLALAKLGAISFPIHPLKDYESREKIVKKFNIKYLISPDQEFIIDGVKYIKINNLSIVDFKYSLDDFDTKSIELDDPFRMALSTGTTGDPKGVLLSHKQTLKRIQNKLMPCEASTKLVPFDLSYAMGLVFSLNVLEKGGCLVFLNKHQSNEGIWHSINYFGITDLILSPAQVFDKLRFLPSEKLDYPKLKSIQIVGDKCPQNVIQALKNNVTRHIYSSYGISEVGGIALANLELLERYPNITGQISNTLEIKCIDQNGKEVSEGQLGHIIIKTESMPQSYFMNPEKTKIQFVDGWFYTGDLGKIMYGNLLFLDSRIDNLINIGGQVIDPAYFEEKIKELSGIEDAFVFAYEVEGNVSHLALIFSGQKNINIEKLAKSCKENLKINFSVIKYAKEIPKEANGKIARDKLAKIATEQIKLKA